MLARMRTVWPGTVFSTVASLSAVCRTTSSPSGSRTVTDSVIRSSTWWEPDRKPARASSSPLGSIWVR
jgi:hypothetical protein